MLIPGQNRRPREAEYYIICVLRLNYASVCGESPEVTAPPHFLPIATTAAGGGSRLWLDRCTLAPVSLSSCSLEHGREPDRFSSPPCQPMCSFKKLLLGPTFSPWLCAAGICERVCPASASQRGWGWILWAECWRAAPAPSSASLPAGAPSSAAPTDVPGKQTTAAKERPSCSARDTVVLSSATVCPGSFRLTQSLCFRASSSAVELSLGDSSEVIFFSICAQMRT